MSKDDQNWIEKNLDFIAQTWIPVDDPEQADLRITTEQIAIKIFEMDPGVPKGTIEMLQERLSELGFKRCLVTWPEIPGDPQYSRKDNCWAICWLLKMNK